MEDRWIALFLLLCANGAVSYVPILGAWGPECESECTKKGNDYYWCYSRTVSQGWDYCSPFINVASNGAQCRSNHQCGNHGYDYRWCYTDDSNNWHYCSAYGIENPNQVRQITRYGRFCASPCQPKDGEYKCTAVGTGEEDTCSPRHNTLVNNVTPCRYNHYCDMHGNAFTWYYWCYHDNNNNWGYCSAVYDCSYSPKPEMNIPVAQPRNTSAINEPEKRRYSCLKACGKDHVSDLFAMTTVCEVRDFAGQFNVSIQEENDPESNTIIPYDPNFHHVTNVIEAYTTHRIEDSNFRQLNSHGPVAIFYTAQEIRAQSVYAVIRVSMAGSKLSDVLFPVDTTFSPRFTRRAMMNCIHRQCRTILMHGQSAQMKQGMK